MLLYMKQIFDKITSLLTVLSMASALGFIPLTATASYQPTPPTPASGQTVVVAAAQPSAAVSVSAPDLLCSFSAGTSLNQTSSECFSLEIGLVQQLANITVIQPQQQPRLSVLNGPLWDPNAISRNGESRGMGAVVLPLLAFISLAALRSLAKRAAAAVITLNRQFNSAPLLSYLQVYRC